ncbi:hypothetical protein ACE193_08575 [Bernardetia sp. OM2101]|uniref:hypothetical protein n=1 Tax=Bernardetia sp. OM2101 TaxID=3344876 RepID=UPI0035CEBADA
MKTKLVKFHFIILLILVVNIFVTNIFNFGLNSYAKMLLAFLLVGSGFSLFALNFKRLFKPFTFLKVYSTFYITIPLLILFFWNSNEYWNNSISYRFERTLSTGKLVYEQSNYKIYEYMKPSIFNTPNGGCSNSFSTEYFLDKNYFIFKTRLGYFHSVYKDRENTNFEIPMSLIEEDMKNINVANDSIFINFYESDNMVFEIEE